MKTLPLIAGLSVGLSLTFSVRAQSLLIDFGPTSAASSAARLNSPGHATGLVGASETTWNQIQTADVASGLRFSNGDAATGVGIDLGVESTGTSNIIDFLTQPNSSLQGNNGAYSTGVYSPFDSPSRDFVYHSFNNEPWAIGVKITGLAAGVYRVLVAGGNVHGASAGTMNFFAAAGGGTTFNFGALSPTSITNATDGVGAWTQGVNYAALSISITAGQDLFLAASGTGSSAGGRGFLNSLELVRVGAIPEPGAFATVAGALALGAVSVARRKRQ